MDFCYLFTKQMKDQLLKGLDYMYQLPPSKWDPVIITRFKARLLPKLMMFITNAEDQKEDQKDNEPLSAVAENIFNGKDN